MKRQTERRAHPRLAEKHKVTATVASCPEETAIEGRQFTGQTRNLSTGGFQFVARRSFPVGTIMDIRLECSRPYEVVQRQARVVWCQETASANRPLVGVYFSDKSKEKAIAWRRMLNRRIEQS